MIEQIYPYLILTGATIGAVMFVLWRQAGRIGRINIALIRLNEQLDFDTLAFLRAAWPLLSQAGLQGISWKLDWFGVTIEDQAGKQNKQSVIKEIRAAETCLVISLFHQGAYGERRYFSETITETFLLLLRTNMWIKVGAAQASFMQMSRLHLFLQHDMKNVAQYIQFMADQLAAVPAGKELLVLDYLRTSAPLIRNRADRIVSTLMGRQPEDRPLRVYPLRDTVAQLCRLHRLDCEIHGDAEIHASENTLDSALDNILKNYADSAQRNGCNPPTVQVGITDNGDKIGITLESPDSVPVQHLERLFEPFWSSDPAGLGIGLYQARQMLEACGGTLLAGQNGSGRLRFVLCLPHPLGEMECAGSPEPIKHAAV